MIKITVDEAYAFDYLSILELKKINGKDVVKIIEIIKNDIISVIGYNVFTEIITSIEYKNLLESNKLTFEAVDKAKTDSVLASYVDKCNYERMICKNNLQSKFFNTNLSEVKIGYEKLNKK